MASPLTLWVHTWTAQMDSARTVFGPSRDSSQRRTENIPLVKEKPPLVLFRGQGFVCGDAVVPPSPPVPTNALSNEHFRSDRNFLGPR